MEIRCRMEERDVDLLLLEELLASATFRAWFLPVCGLTPHLTPVTGGRSISTANGESDIEIEFEDGAHRIQLLIENKINAAFQATQPERYRQRAQQRISAGSCTACRTVLFAPMAYINHARQRPDAESFDAFVPFEDVVSWLQSEGGARNQIRARLLQNALDGLREGRTFDVGVTAFHTAYWQVQLEVAPELEMKRPEARGGSSTFIVFRPRFFEVDRKRRFCEFQHKVEKGYLDFELRGRGAVRREFLEQHGAAIPPWMSVERASGSLAIRVQTTRLDVNSRFDEQEAAVREALQKAARLLRWMEQNPEMVHFGR